MAFDVGQRFALQTAQAFTLELLLRCRGDRLPAVSQKPGACQPGGPRQQQLRIQP